jgi:hypothetical protein
MASGVDNDIFIIQFLPIYLADTAKAWLDHLPRNMIDCWEDLREIFTDNFQGTYVWLGNPWDLKGCQQNKDESMWDYIQRFSRKCHELLKICDTDVISTFWSNMNCRTQVHDLDRDQPKTMKEILDIATRHASGEEAVRAIFLQNSGKVAPDGGRGATPRQPTRARRGV